MKMMWISLGYLLCIGFLGFLIGRFLPRSWFRYDAFPYRSYAFEQDGSFYRKLYIQKWHTRVPDMSRIFSRWMPPKRLYPGIRAAEVRVMVQETCIAEFTHVALSIAGLALIRIWPGIGGFALTFFNIFPGNLMFVIIQRFNRPKLVRLMHMLEARESKNNPQTSVCF